MKMELQPADIDATGEYHELNQRAFSCLMDSRIGYAAKLFFWHLWLRCGGEPGMIRRTSVKELALPKGDAKRFLRELEAEGFIEIHRYHAGSRDPDLIFPGDLRILVSFPSLDRPLTKEEKIERRRNHDQRLFPFMEEEQSIVPIVSPVSSVHPEQIPGAEIVPPREVQKLSAIFAPPETNRSRGAKNEHDIPKPLILPTSTSDAVKSASSESPEYGISKRQPLDLKQFKFLFPESDTTVDCRKDEETTSESVVAPAKNEVQKLSAIFAPPGIDRSRGAKIDPRGQVQKMPLVPTQNGKRGPVSSRSQESETTAETTQHPCRTGVTAYSSCTDREEVLRQAAAVKPIHGGQNDENEVQKLPLVSEPTGQETSKNAKPYNISNIQFEIFEYSQIHQIPQVRQIEEFELLEDFQSEGIDKLDGKEWIKKRIQLSAKIENEFTAVGVPFPKPTIKS